MCRSTIEGGRRCADHRSVQVQSAARALRRTRVRDRIASLPTAPLSTLAESLAPGTGQAERDAALEVAAGRDNMLAEWFALADSPSTDDRLAAALLPCSDGRAAAGYQALSIDYDPRIRRAVASNPATSPKVLSDLATDPDESTRQAAQSSLAAQSATASAPSDEAIAFRERAAVNLDDTPHAEVTRTAMRRPGWVAPADAAPLIVAAAQVHDVRVVIHPGTIPGATGVVEISEIRAGDRGAGAGSRALRDIHALADQHGWALALRPSGDLGGDVERLRGWYSREGYSPSAPGADKRLRRSLTDWVRYPKGQDS